MSNDWKYCRLCANITPQFEVIDIFVNNTELGEKICTFFKIELSDNDIKLPKTICKECYSKVNLCLEFGDLVQRAQCTLREIFNEVIPERYDNIEDIIVPEIKCEEYEQSDKEIGDNCLEDEIVFEKKSTRNLKVRLKETRRRNQGNSEFYREIWKNYNWQCSDCGEDNITSVKQLRNHYSELHKKLPEYLCILCSKLYKYNQFRPFYKHVYNHYHKNITKKHVSPNEPFDSDIEVKSVCSECGKSFKSAQCLQRHAIVHLPDEKKPKFDCTTCNKTFQTKYALKHHHSVHSGERILTYCEQCGKGFTTKSNMLQHKQTQHSEERPYHCEQCPKSFKSIPNLHSHLKVHKNLRPHKCEICGNVFATKATLKRHSSTHENVLPFECEFCHKRFRIAQFLKIHLRQHTGERPFSCEECNHHFANSSNYIKHMKGRHGVFSIAKSPVRCNAKYLTETNPKM